MPPASRVQFHLSKYAIEPMGHTLLAEGLYEPRPILKRVIAPVALLYIVLLIVGLPEVLRLPARTALAVVFVEASLLLMLFLVVVFIAEARQRLWVDRDAMRFRYQLSLRQHVLREIELAFGDIEEVRAILGPAGWTVLARDLFPVVVVERRRLQTEFTLMRFADREEAREVAERMREEMQVS